MIRERNKSELITYIKFNEAYFPRPWGNYNLPNIFNKPVPPNEKIGEIWLISDRNEFQSKVIKGRFIGKTIHELVTTYPQYLFGNRKGEGYPSRFPLLLKIINANEILSVQVHPSDQKAKELNEHDCGKTEMWYIMEAKPNSFIYLGLRKNVKKEHLLKEIQHGGDVDRLLRKIYVKQGDHYLIPAGTIHAIGPGIILAEIQQNSNLTYRLYDWNRLDLEGKPRELHLEKAFYSIETCQTSIAVPKIDLKHSFGREKFLCSTPYFSAKYWEIKSETKIWNNNYSFHIIFSLDTTKLSVETEEKETLQMERGECVLIPSVSSDRVTIDYGTFLDYYVP